MGTWLLIGVLGLMPPGQGQEGGAWWHMERITNNLETWNDYPAYRPVLWRRLLRERWLDRGRKQ